MTEAEVRKLKIGQAFEKWQLTISSRKEEEDFLRLRSSYDELLGPLVIDPRFEMEPEDRTDPQRLLPFQFQWLFIEIPFQLQLILFKFLILSKWKQIDEIYGA